MTPSPISCRKAAPRGFTARWCATRKSRRYSAGFSGLPGTKYPHLFAFYAFPLPGHTPQEMADAIHAEIERLKKEDISDDELKMIKTRAKANLIRGLGRQRRTGDAAGDLPDALRRLARVVPLGGPHRQRYKADIRRVANETFRDTNRTVGVIETTAGGEHAPGPRCARCKERSRSGRCAMKMNQVVPFADSRSRRHPRAAAQAASQAKSWQQIPIPPLPAFHPQQPKRIELSNGMVIFLQEDHELPLIDGSARIRGGSRNEPASKVGLVDIFGEVWRTGGTKTQTGDQLDDFLEVRAAKVETGGGPDSTSISLVLPERRFRRRFQSLRRRAAESRIPRRQTRHRAEAEPMMASRGATTRPEESPRANPPSSLTVRTIPMPASPSIPPSPPSRARI